MRYRDFFEDTAIRENIPYIIYGGISFYERREIKDMLAYIRVILNPNQDFFPQKNHQCAKT